jgi:hypothetical protein
MQIFRDRGDYVTHWDPNKTLPNPGDFVQCLKAICRLCRFCASSLMSTRFLDLTCGIFRRIFSEEFQFWSERTADGPMWAWISQRLDPWVLLGSGVLGQNSGSKFSLWLSVPGDVSNFTFGFFRCTALVSGCAVPSSACFSLLHLSYHRF